MTNPQEPIEAVVERVLTRQGFPPGYDRERFLVYAATWPAESSSGAVIHALLLALSEAQAELARKDEALEEPS